MTSVRFAPPKNECAKRNCGVEHPSTDIQPESAVNVSLLTGPCDQLASTGAPALRARHRTRKSWLSQPFMVAGNVENLGPETWVQPEPVNARGASAHES